MDKLGLEIWWLGVCCWSKMVYQLQKLAHQLEEQLQIIRSLFQLDVPTGFTSPITPQDKLLILHRCLVLEPDSVGSLSQFLGWTEAQVSLAFLAKWLECPSPRHYPHASVDWKRAEYFFFLFLLLQEKAECWFSFKLMICKTIKYEVIYFYSAETFFLSAKHWVWQTSCDVRVLTWAPK